MVRNNRVVMNAEGDTVGLRTADGKVVWRSQSEPWGYPTPTLGADRAYITGPECVFGLDLDDGEQTWHGTPCHGANTASGTIANGRLYLQYGGYFSALDANGDITWASPHDARGSPAILDQTAYVATSFTAEAVDLTGDPIELPWQDPDDDTPAHVSEQAATKWSFPSSPFVTDTQITISPAVAGDLVFVTVTDEGEPGGKLRALDRASGDEQWSIAAPPLRPTEGSPPEPVSSPTPPVVTDELVVTALGDRRIQAASHTGTIQWTRELGREVTELAAGNDTLLALTHDRSVETTAPAHTSLVALDLSSGIVLWRLEFEDHLDGLAVAAETVYMTLVTDRQDTEVRTEQLLALG